MKGKIRYYVQDQEIEKEVNYIPVRYIIAMMLAILETVAIVGIMIALCYYVPYFYLAVWMTQIACIVRIIASNDNPDYKIPWLLFLFVVPIAGFMLYFLFYSRTLKKKYIKRLKALKDHSYTKDDSALFAQLKEENIVAHNQAKMLCEISESHLFSNTKQVYFPLGEAMHKQMIEDLKGAKEFIFMEYFIVEEGIFWNSILEILKEKVKSGVKVKVVYDDIGCMSTLPGNYDKILRSYGIEATMFSKLKGNADSEFNNRSHRKILVIDGIVGYTGGVNIADEYINEVERFGHWKDIGVRLEGEAVKELTKLFLIDFGINVKTKLESFDKYFLSETVCAFSKEKIMNKHTVHKDFDENNTYHQNVKSNDSIANGYMIPFGDGPSPLYNHRVGKCVIQNLITQANRYVYIMTPYLIVDNEMCQTIENAALRGVDVKIIVPHIPDKKLVFEMTKSHYERFVKAGVEIYEYEPGFIHAKSYLVDDIYGMIGTINLDYRSLVHHFENGVWMYQCDCLKDMKEDFIQTMNKSIKIEGKMIKSSLVQRLIRSLVKIFSPLL